jgi:hypothetical protein
MERDLKLAKQLGFRNLRLLIGTPVDVIEKSIPLAGNTISAGTWKYTRPAHRWLNPDRGLFSMREVRADHDSRSRDGLLRPMAASLVNNAHARKLPFDLAIVELQKADATESEMDYLKAVYSPAARIGRSWRRHVMLKRLLGES